MLYDLESHAKDGTCGLPRNEDICQSVGKLVEKQTLGGVMKRGIQKRYHAYFCPVFRRTNRQHNVQIVCTFTGEGYPIQGMLF